MTVTGPVGNYNAGGASYGYQWRIGEGQRELHNLGSDASVQGGGGGQPPAPAMEARLIGVLVDVSPGCQAVN